MRWVKRLIKTPMVRRMAGWLAAHYMTLVYYTSRWTTSGVEHVEPFWKEGKPFLKCFWHNRLGMLCFSWQGVNPFSMLMSGHADGEIIAHGVAHHGIQWIKGSSSKGGAQALRTIIKKIKAGHTIGITPDGPRGPCYVASKGMVAIAKLAKIPIIPIAYSTTRYRVLKTWDQFILPLPFSKGIFVWGPPLLVDHMDEEIAQRAIQIALDEVTKQADLWSQKAREGA